MIDFETIEKGVGVKLMDSQVLALKQGLPILSNYGWVYLAMQERTGKTLSALLLAFLFNENAKVLVITKKKAIAGWNEWIGNDYFKDKYITVTNYENLYGLKENEFNLVVLDECHNALSSYPTISQTCKKLAPLCRKKNIIYSTATPCNEGFAKIFHQLWLCDYSPFSHTNYATFYIWHKKYGIPSVKHFNSIVVKDYSMVKDKEVLEVIEPYFVRIKRNFDYEPKDVLIEVPYTPLQKRLIKMISQGGFRDYVDENGISHTKIIENKVSEIMAIWQIEGGYLLTDSGVLNIATNKLNYIKQDKNANSAIFCYFKQEQASLPSHHNHVYHYLKDSEGVDLSNYDKGIVYTSTFSATKYSQVRSRLCNIKRDKPIEIEWLTNGKDSIGHYIYECVAKKQKNFSARLYSLSNEYKKMIQNLI